MSEDIFASWKDSRFIIAPAALVDKEQLVVLTDTNTGLTIPMNYLIGAKSTGL
jgi:hypothetical protein